ncbi:retinal cone rhodopsin-sensitive cGMP 3',5'-cyclic phosphodiesterase subunit gamma-like [Hippocampus zosterae]|uniref:retinal cone rhodopsin-sensitive cGMP 3',5'-cyclic phosphodiesterase subunit gamma-like n=1 Tax=Hippocampus zosterae TaxID=109293 RepID=UPI00223CEE25|nr:retinal cone rhodopsin-sensitive cGMP 3',5'-cyclic phosphodiesterase subunit gamma-like [Hippocampus zosterae]
MKAQNRECKKKEKITFVLHLFLFRPSRLRRLLLDSTKPQTDIQASKMNTSAGEQGNKAAPPKFKKKETRQFKSKAPKAGQKGFDNDVPGMEVLGDSAVICPWEAFGDIELSDLAQFGIV